MSGDSLGTHRWRSRAQGRRNWVWAGLFAGLLAMAPGCGLQYSFRRPKKEKKEEPFRAGSLLRPEHSGAQAGYVRAYSSWFADHATLTERLNGNPKIVQDIYKRLRNHLTIMHGHMFRKEAETFERDVIRAYDALMNPWPNRASPLLVERRLNTLDSRVRRDYAPGKFPIKASGESPEEEED